MRFRTLSAKASGGTSLVAAIWANTHCVSSVLQCSGKVSMYSLHLRAEDLRGCNDVRRRLLLCVVHALASSATTHSWASLARLRLARWSDLSLSTYSWYLMSTLLLLLALMASKFTSERSLTICSEYTTFSASTSARRPDMSSSSATLVWYSAVTLWTFRECVTPLSFRPLVVLSRVV